MFLIPNTPCEFHSELGSGRGGSGFGSPPSLNLRGQNIPGGKGRLSSGFGATAWMTPWIGVSSPPGQTSLSNEIPSDDCEPPSNGLSPRYMPQHACARRATFAAGRVMPPVSLASTASPSYLPGIERLYNSTVKCLATSRARSRRHRRLAGGLSSIGHRICANPTDIVTASKAKSVPRNHGLITPLSESNDSQHHHSGNGLPDHPKLQLTKF